MNKYTKRFEIENPVYSSFNVDAQYPGGDLRIVFEYDSEDGSYQNEFIFHKVRAFRSKADLYCSNFEVENASCILIEVIDSEWITDLESLSIDKSPNWVMNHYMIYFPEEGCYEVIAESSDCPPSTKVI